MTFSVGAKHHVVRQVHIPDKPHAQTILGNERKPYAQFPDLRGGFLPQIDFFIVVFGIEVSDRTAFQTLKSRD